MINISTIITNMSSIPVQRIRGVFFRDKDKYGFNYSSNDIFGGSLYMRYKLDAYGSNLIKKIDQQNLLNLVCDKENISGGVDAILIFSDTFSKLNNNLCKVEFLSQQMSCEFSISMMFYEEAEILYNVHKCFPYRCDECKY